MNVLVVGSGGREHALVWKIRQSPEVDTLYCAPGNAGIARQAECIDIAVKDFKALADFAADHSIGLTVVGPEDPLASGIVDYFTERGLLIFGPTAGAAQLEASKVFAKESMIRCGIPTAAHGTFTDPQAACAYVRSQGKPVVIKADGLAAGKGVTVCDDIETAERAIRQAMVEKVFDEAGARILVEERLLGEEASILAFTDGRTVLPMASSQDHKPAYDGDTGPNTGGMGAYSPAPLVTPLFDTIRKKILEPCVQELARQGLRYRGVLYAGLMITEDGPKVLEFNCRFGDPEVQAILPRLQTDLVPVLLACCDGTLDRMRLEWAEEACVSVVMASGGYPGSYEKGKIITGIEDAERTGAVVFHAGTQLADGQLVTNGGRVLNVTALGSEIPHAIANSYAAVRLIHFDGAHYRTDIGQKALKHLQSA